MKTGFAGLGAMALCLAISQAPARAAVTQVTVLERTPFAGGRAFGTVGAYEKIRGRAVVSLDPDTPANATIVDLRRAPRDPHGRVTFTTDFLLLRPVKATQSTLLYEVNNRGGIGILGQLDGHSPAHNDPTTLADAGDGFLMRHGFSLLWSAWTWDVAPPSPGDRPLVLSPPVATEDGRTITGKVENEFTVLQPAAVTNFAGLHGLTYPPAVADDPEAVLTERARPDDPRRPVARSRWRFAAPKDGGPVQEIALDGGFKPGVLYEVSYTAQNPYVVGVGLAGIRDLMAWFRDHPLEGAAPPKRSLIFGISQSGRVISTMLLNGLNLDEQGRPVFDAAFIHVPGAGKGGFNYRFAQPTRHFSLLEEHDYPADTFPFTTTTERDPVTGQTGSLLDHARTADGRAPKLLFVNTSTEFWNRSAGLLETTPDGTADVTPDKDTRLYFLAGSQHYVGRSHERAPYLNCVSTTDHYLAMRAMLLGLERWVKDGTPPPASNYPRVADGTLISVEDYRAVFPKGLSLTPPETNLKPPRLDLGPRFASQGIADTIPPTHGTPFNTLVPRPDADGNDLAGVRQVELRVPLGTHTGWNERSPEVGFAWATARFDGSFQPFARTEAERRADHDPRPSLEARYGSRDAYVAKVRAAANEVATAGFLLPEDMDRVVSEQTGLYDRIQGHAPGDTSCEYLFAQ
ncbi:alpha/beta hydrolase domain-containing protein [Caulobacter sp. S45]|uniref:alpha/beta hydrolase domain-containing protein n=1 Tax=Caulobacter sp. S45 TaxID=1641861 RepID=UPI00131B70BC|nr:alpha/beta hydrolase domain-containing protein [Caulobacter sp. S45]